MNAIQKLLPLIIVVGIFVLLTYAPTNLFNNKEKIFSCSKNADLCSEIEIDSKTKQEVQIPLIRLSEIEQAVLIRHEQYSSSYRAIGGIKVTYYKVGLINKYCRKLYELPKSKSKDNAERIKTEFTNYLKNNDQESYRLKIDN